MRPPDFTRTGSTEGATVNRTPPPGPALPRQLRERPILGGERWIFSAGFNVPKGLPDTSRIDVELEDIAYLAKAGASVAVLSHRGRARDADCTGLADIAEYMSARLGRPVGYFPENASDAAAAAALAQRPGGVTVFGNTRHHGGEERNDPALARAFAGLGDFVAVGGFSKAHRRHASNLGILAVLPGWAAGSLSAESALLAPWSGREAGTASLAVLGGVKPEKSLLGLPAFASDYDVVVPGGAVLNNLLRAAGHEVGDSELGDKQSECARMAEQVLCSSRAALHLPRYVYAARTPARPAAEVERLAIEEGVPRGYAIVDFELQPWLGEYLKTLMATGGRMLVAGTPGIYRSGFDACCRPLLAAASHPGVRSILMGGDTVSELPFHGVTSTGGGAALHFLRHQDLPVLEALRAAGTGIGDN